MKIVHIVAAGGEMGIYGVVGRPNVKTGQGAALAVAKVLLGVGLALVGEMSVPYLRGKIEDHKFKALERQQRLDSMNDPSSMGNTNNVRPSVFGRRELSNDELLDLLVETTNRSPEDTREVDTTIARMIRGGMTIAQVCDGVLRRLEEVDEIDRDLQQNNTIERYINWKADAEEAVLDDDGNSITKFRKYLDEMQTMADGEAPLYQLLSIAGEDRLRSIAARAVQRRGDRAGSSDAG